MVRANLIEVFQSLQGEGPHVGEPMVFVRFQDCALSCRYCDTPASFKKHQKFRVEAPAGSVEFRQEANPVTGSRLTQILGGFCADTLSLTGGEPLQHWAFLRRWLPTLGGHYRVLLETNGILVEELKPILPWVDIISMDIKIPSSTGMRAYWKEHRAFLELAVAKEVYVKAVITAETTEEEIHKATHLVQEVAPQVPFVLQPVTPFGPVRQKVEPQVLRHWLQISRAQLGDVRVIPQMHPHLGIL